MPEPGLEVRGGFKGRICEDGRAQWQDVLEQAGVRLSISGHTHRRAWFPPGPGGAFGQLIGGDPLPAQATTIRVEADALRLRFSVETLSGTVLFQDVHTA